MRGPGGDPFNPSFFRNFEPAMATPSRRPGSGAKTLFFGVLDGQLFELGRVRLLRKLLQVMPFESGT